MTRRLVGRGSWLGLAALTLAVLAAGPPEPALAQPLAMDGLEEARGPEVHPTGVATAGFLLVGALALEGHPPPSAARWRGGLLFDDAVRGLRLETRQQREAADAASTVLRWTLFLYPALDALLVAWLARDAPALALRMLAADALGFAAAAFALAGSKLVVGRERPFVRGCATDADYHPDCEQPRRLRSFLSGHTIFASTGAGLVCAQHRALPLYGGGAPDAVACASAVTVAAVTGLLRILGDEHYLTDVLASAAVGFLAGYLLPGAVFR